MTLEALSKLHNDVTAYIEDNDIRSSFTIMRQNRNIFKDFKTLEDEYTQNDYKGTTLANFKNRLLILVDSAVHNKENSINTAKSNQEPEVAEFASLQQKITDAKDELQSLERQIKRKKIELQKLEERIETTKTKQEQAEEWFEKGNNQKTWNDSVDVYSKAIELHPTYVDAYFERGKSNYQLKQYTVALKDFNKVIELNSANENVYFERAKTRYKLSHYDKAISDVSEAIAYNPNNAEYYWLRACCYALKIEDDNALFELSLAIDLDAKYKAIAKKDRDFARFSRNKKFKELTE